MLVRLATRVYLPPLCGVTSDALGCLNAITDSQAMQVMLSALFPYALHASPLVCFANERPPPRHPSTHPSTNASSCS